MRWLLALVITGTVGCSTVSPLLQTRSSPEEVAGAMLDAIARRDRGELQALVVSEQEFRNHVWPSLPAARPERNLPWSYVWSDLRQKSEAMLERTLSRHGGRRYELVTVSFDDRTDYGSYRVHHDARLAVRDESGAVQDIRVSGSMIEHAGAWKIFSYVINN